MKVSHMLIFVFVCCIACSNEREAPNGLKVKVLRKGEGSFAAPGEFLVMSMVIKDSKDSVWKDTRMEGVPLIVPVGKKSQIDSEKGVESALRVLKKGDSVRIDIAVKTFFEGRPMPPNLRQEDMMSLFLSVSDITDQRGVIAIQQQLRAEQFEENRKLQGEQLVLDTVAIETYLASRKVNATRDKSGLRYVITQLGKGAKPALSSKVRVKYKGSFMENGEVFDQGEITYPLKDLIQGWQIIFQLLPKESKAMLYIPSTLGYGVNGYPPGIPPNANLVFEVELIDFN